MFPRFSRLLKRGVLTSSRSLSYPRVPLTSPIPNLESPARAENTRQQLEALEKWNVEDSRFPPTTITQLENGLRVASQEAFGQHSTIGGKLMLSEVLGSQVVEEEVLVVKTVG